MDKMSYGLGVLLGSNLKQQGFDEVTGADFLKGFEAVLAGSELEVSPDEANQLIQQHLASGIGQQNLDAGQAYLTKNGTRAEITSLPSGLQYEILTKGDGPKPQATDTVTTLYHGTLIDGTVFDSSVERNQPASFPVNGVIQGWVEALQMMPVGSKWKLHVPSHLAYGDRGAGGAIGPNATLIFDVELIKIGD